MIRSGIYFIEKDCREIETAVDRATIARKSVDYIIRSTSVVFNDGPFDSSYRENEIINRMEYALKHGEFKVYLQPKVGLDGLGIVGAEALVRWQHEDGRIVRPGISSRCLKKMVLSPRWIPMCSGRSAAS